MTKSMKLTTLTSKESSSFGKKSGWVWRQYLAAFLVNISTFVAGIVYGWSAPILPVLQSENSAIGIPPITDGDASWLASVYGLSRLVTVPLYMFTIDRFGCKVTGYLVAAPFLLGYSLLMFANSVAMLFWGRIFCGIAAGGTGILGPTYTSDIAEDSNKGKLGVIFAETMIIGLTFAYAVGYYASYRVYHGCCILLTVAFTLALLWIPESPLFLMTTGKTEKAKEVLKWLRNDKESEFEFERMKTRAEEVLQKRKRKVSLAELKDRRLLRAFFIVLGLTLNQQVSGMGPIEAYTVMIFEKAGSVIPPNITTILLGVFMIVGSLISYITIERCGRRILLLSSDLVITMCLTAVSIYFYLQSLGWNMESFGWLPIASMYLYIVSTSLGLGSLPFMIGTEMVHPNYRSFVQASNVMFMSITCFVLTLTYMPLVKVIGHHGCFCLYAACCAIGTVYVFFTVPETKNRSLEEILQQLNSDNYIRSVLYYKEETNNIVKNAPSGKAHLTPELEKI